MHCLLKLLLFEHQRKWPFGDVKRNEFVAVTGGRMSNILPLFGVWDWPSGACFVERLKQVGVVL